MGLKKGSLSADSVSADAPDNTISTRSSQQRGRGQPSARAGQSVSGAAEYDDEPDAFASLGRGRTVKAQSRINAALNKEAAEDNGLISPEDARRTSGGAIDPVSRR